METIGTITNQTNSSKITDIVLRMTSRVVGRTVTIEEAMGHLREKAKSLGIDYFDEILNEHVGGV
jgi:hypothetical protein